MVRAIVSGAAGRMGGRIIHMMEGVEGITLAAAVERSDNPAVGKEVGEVVGLPAKGVTISGSLAEVLAQGDVVIEFTHPESSLAHLKMVAEAGKAMVLGTTGLSPAQLSEVRAQGARTRLVFAPNMSVGVNLMFQVVADIARVLSSGYDVEIVEAHHRLKKDAPSGTALKLAQVIAQALDRDLEKVGVYARQGIIGERTTQEIGIQTVRAGDIVGEHTVLFGGMGERLEITHRAHSRDNFARGAVRAATWIVGQAPGLYDMQDVLGLK
ncbi:MAG: 4-hydroxy-tetrahydrodipicolinate reductase [Syntrophales bacterium]|nr:4-hydroxy-tetrahydrodipicolinate reductase [Syntrophales bacterium]MDD5643327.1 4-hydroxy-tetrahydrodipicolinate reductase [Syntrophales bacterium]